MREKIFTVTLLKCDGNAITVLKRPPEAAIINKGPQLKISVNNESIVKNVLRPFMWVFALRINQILWIHNLFLVLSLFESSYYLSFFPISKKRQHGFKFTTFCGEEPNCKIRFALICLFSYFINDARKILKG